MSNMERIIASHFGIPNNHLFDYLHSNFTSLDIQKIS